MKICVLIPEGKQRWVISMVSGLEPLLYWFDLESPIHSLSETSIPSIPMFEWGHPITQTAWQSSLWSCFMLQLSLWNRHLLLNRSLLLIIIIIRVAYHNLCEVILRVKHIKTIYVLIGLVCCQCSSLKNIRTENKRGAGRQMGLGVFLRLEDTILPQPYYKIVPVIS